MPIFYDVQPGKYDLKVLKKSYKKMLRDLPGTPKDTPQRWVDALTWVHGVSGVTGWRHNPKSECVPSRTPCSYFCHSGLQCALSLMQSLLLTDWRLLCICFAIIKQGRSM